MDKKTAAFIMVWIAFITIGFLPFDAIVPRMLAGGCFGWFIMDLRPGAPE